MRVTACAARDKAASPASHHHSGASCLTLFLVMQASSDRMASFQKVIERSHSQVTSLKASVNNIFQAVSAKRFRDVAPDIRALVIQGIADWTTSLPADFLQDQYLKYVAWALSDRVTTTALDMQQPRPPYKAGCTVEKKRLCLVTSI